MKTTPLVLFLLLIVFGLEAQMLPTNMTPAQRRLLEMRLHALTNRPAMAPAGRPPGFGGPMPMAGAPAPATPAAAPAVSANAPGAMPAETSTASSSSSSAPQKEEAGYTYNFPGVDVSQVLDVYANLVGRTLIRGPLPQASIVLHTQSPLTKSEAIEALQAVLALNGIALVNIGQKFVKVLPPDQAGKAGGAFNEENANQLPDMGSYVTHIVQLHYVKPSAMVPILTPFAHLPDAITPLDDNGILVLRDYAENVKRMLEMIAKVDVSVPAEYISEVIPIKYAQADDIANALNSLGGSGGSTVSIGGSTSAPRISGLAGTPESRFGGMGGTQNSFNSPTSPFGQSRTGLGTEANANARPTGSPFQRRLLNIINAAGGGGGGQEPIQIFGQAKIIADERSNSLLIFATRHDMLEISNIISKLDVLLPQVLIEAVVIDYALGPNSVNFGVSAAQSPQAYSSNPQTAGAGGVNNGQSFLNLFDLLNGGSLSNSVFGDNLGAGLSYFGNIGPRWDVALQAAANDSRASIIQRPRILAEQAKPAQFFVGETVPYVTSTYNYGGAYGNQSSYSQLSVGVELDVTPYINPDGLVDMIIQQEIDDINGYTTITGVGNIPNTDKRTLNSEIAVRDRDTVMLGGFIKNAKSSSRAGVPFLEDIPLLGGLFSSHSSSKQREELIVLMRPTVLKTPALAAENTIAEEQRLPGVSATAAQAAAEQAKAVEAERKRELKNSQSMSGGFYNSALPANAPERTAPQTQGDDFFTPAAPNTAPAAPSDNNYNYAEPQH